MYCKKGCSYFKYVFNKYLNRGFNIILNRYLENYLDNVFVSNFQLNKYEKYLNETNYT